jgi:predicted molibdopterin-dependent oxidoreductase YjgC
MIMAKVTIKIEGISYQVEEGLTILEAAKACGYEIPSLCAFNHGECSQGSCRVCLVEVKGARGLVASCVYPVNEGMEVIISSPKATEARRASVALGLEMTISIPSLTGYTQEATKPLAPTTSTRQTRQEPVLHSPWLKAHKEGIS